MLQGLKITCLLLLVWMSLLFLFQTARNQSASLTAQLRVNTAESPEFWFDEWQKLAAEARARSALYEAEIKRNHLTFGMVVSRHSDGRPGSECDSLLFSSLRYVALKKMGWEDKAKRAWRGIEGAYQNGRWVRHPKCRRKSTSRDMIIGLLIALSQHPAGEVRHLQNLVDIVQATGGSVDDGPFYVSRLSPGVGELMRHLMVNQNFPLRNLPDEIRLGFSTLEFDTWLASPGYISHLNALNIWLELELARQDQRIPIRSLGDFAEAVTASGSGLENQRLAWVSQRLAAVDPANLFFAWLQLQSAGALTWKTRATLLAQLLAMPQFPATHLPRSCDRSADYLWQRDSIEYARPANGHCDETFPGVDFLWLTALLTEGLDL